MSDSRYLRKSLHGLLGHLIEECGEVLSAAGKTVRWGLESYNPELQPRDPTYRETNRAWLLREMIDLELSIARLRQKLAPERYPSPQAKPLPEQQTPHPKVTK